MKLSKSKLALARVINENGGWVEVATFAVSGYGCLGTTDTEFVISFFNGKSKPSRDGENYWSVGGGDSDYCGDIHSISIPHLPPNWHQTILSREEYCQAYPKADDEWIEWNGGECPVDDDSLVDVRFPDGSEYFNTDADWDWSNASDTPISHYRPSKKEDKPEFCESVMRSIPEPEAEGVQSRLDDALAIVKVAAPHLLNEKYKFDGDEVMGERKPSIEQLAADYRNAKDYADRKRQEADSAKAASDAALGELERAGEALGLLIGIAKPDCEPELAITDWRDLRVNDVIFVGEYDGYESGEYVVVWLEDSDYDGDYAVIVVGIDGIERCMDTAMEWRFIRRP